MQTSAFRGSRTVTSLRLCSRAPWTTSSSIGMRGSLPRLSRSNKCSCTPGVRRARSRSPAPGVTPCGPAAEDEAAEGETEPERAEREGADRHHLAPDGKPLPVAESNELLLGELLAAPLLSAGLPRPGARDRGRRRSPESVPTCFECIASFGRERLRDPHLRPASWRARGRRARRRARGALQRARTRDRDRERRSREPRPRPRAGGGEGPARSPAGADAHRSRESRHPVHGPGPLHDAVEAVRRGVRDDRSVAADTAGRRLRAQLRPPLAPPGRAAGR